MTFLDNLLSRKGSKPHLYLALYARPKHPDVHHQALIIAPKNLTAPLIEIHKFHVKNTLQIQDNQPLQPWVYEASTISSLANEDRLLVLVCIAKLKGSIEEL
ncbi:hypothetical protein BT63DRAFT_428054 [Microthyrium microscopicum]|uniref:Uncharacterized protein n=1 Tax=Microthyrium microscopicum TaxID=703497 RepID=A0A6A6U579_9PEZI|nr:hypothetical protein BT63DRAFT_428054 [Microthyrium microscopicum]